MQDLEFPVSQADNSAIQSQNLLEQEIYSQKMGIIMSFKFKV